MVLCLCGEIKMTEKEAYKIYDDYLNELFPLEGFYCNPFSILLKNGDEIAYDTGFNDFCDAENIKIED